MPLVAVHARLEAPLPPRMLLGMLGTPHILMKPLPDSVGALAKARVGHYLGTHGVGDDLGGFLRARQI